MLQTRNSLALRVTVGGLALAVIVWGNAWSVWSQEKPASKPADEVQIPEGLEEFVDWVFQFSALRRELDLVPSQVDEIGQRERKASQAMREIQKKREADLAMAKSPEERGRILRESFERFLEEKKARLQDLYRLLLPFQRDRVTQLVRQMKFFRPAGQTIASELEDGEVVRALGLMPSRVTELQSAVTKIDEVLQAKLEDSQKRLKEALARAQAKLEQLLTAQEKAQMADALGAEIDLDEVIEAEQAAKAAAHEAAEAAKRGDRKEEQKK